MTEYTASQKRKYLARVLRMNPVYQSGQIIKARNQLLGLTNPDQQELADHAKLEKLRERANGQIEEIRASMWKFSPSRLSEMLRSIDVRQLPELKTAVLRLNQVIKNHEPLQTLAQHPRQHINLTNTFKRVVMSSPKEAGAIKEAYLRQIIESPDLRDIKVMASMLQTEYPNLYAMESDWLNEIQRLKARRKPSLNSGDDVGESYGSGVPGWLIWIGFIIIFRVIAAIVRANSG